MSRHREVTRGRSRPGAVLAVGAVVALALVVAGCSSQQGSAKPAASPPVPSSSSGSEPVSGSGSDASPSVPVPAGVRLTEPGSRLRFGAPATVVYQTTGARGTVLRLTVRGVRRGAPADFRGFILDDSYKRKAAYYYATVSVRNVGRGDVGGVGVPLWGVNASNTLLPAVSFTTKFAPCPSRALPSRFGAGASMTTCLVYLSPNRGTLSAVSYRPSQLVDPITWTGVVTKPPPAKKSSPKKKSSSTKKQSSKKKPSKKKPSKKKPARKPSGKRSPTKTR